MAGHQLEITYTDDAAELPLTRGALVLRVDGAPKTKGSMRHVGKGRMVEQVRGSSAWRELVAQALATRMGQEQGPRGPVRHWRPWSGPVLVQARFLIPRPVGRREDFPVSRFDGDLDKLTRNIGDAMQDAGVIADDSQIISWNVGKRWAMNDRPGVRLEIVAP